MSKKSRNNTIQYDNNDYSNIVDLHGFTIAEALTQVQLSLANAYRKRLLLWLCNNNNR
nr:hypothetical protein [Mycoplasmopsis bovis]